MELDSRPIILARWIRRGNECYLENHNKIVKINPLFEDETYDLYCCANGENTLSDLKKRFENQFVDVFLESLAAEGMCFDILSVSMLGQITANWPDMHRKNLSDDDVFQLQQVEKDPAEDMIPLNANMDSVDKDRVSYRTFANDPMVFSELSQILIASYGLQDEIEMRRSIPSAGAMYPLTHDVLCLRVNELTRGHYRLANYSNSLFKLDSDVDNILEYGFFEGVHRQAAIIHIISFDINRSTMKYGSRAHRFAILEAGHAAQNGIRKATEIGLGSWEYGAYIDEPLCAMLNITSNTSGIGSVVMYGKRKPECIA